MQSVELRRRAHAQAKLCQVTALRDGMVADGALHLNKAGVVPYRVKGTKREYYLLKPVASHAKADDPGFQLCKGTREICNADGHWRDYDKNGRIGQGEKLETLLETALREGIEEAGLRIEQISNLYEWGECEIVSASTGKTKPLWLFVAPLPFDKVFDDPIAELADIEHRDWFDISDPQQAALIRDDHLRIVKAIDSALMAELNQKSGTQHHVSAL